ncbi:hypothetical protein Q9L58_002927 [Maublancomyces gigas]|uniref:Ubiquitin-like domain-containing protein n=1 Tax=Discina gigas TaxID=1032678 RepID=A0ABR3GQI1_9PEZI
MYRKMIEMTVPGDETVMWLVREIEKTKGIPPHQQRFVFGEKKMEPSRSLSSYGIGDNPGAEYIIRFNLQLSGGGSPVMFHVNAGVGNKVFDGEEAVQVELGSADTISDLIIFLKLTYPELGDFKVSFRGKKCADEKSLKSLEFSNTSEVMLTWEEEESEQ